MNRFSLVLVTCTAGLLSNVEGQTTPGGATLSNSPIAFLKENSTFSLTCTNTTRKRIPKGLNGVSAKPEFNIEGPFQLNEFIVTEATDQKLSIVTLGHFINFGRISPFLSPELVHDKSGKRIDNFEYHDSGSLHIEVGPVMAGQIQLRHRVFERFAGRRYQKRSTFLEGFDVNSLGRIFWEKEAGRSDVLPWPRRLSCQLQEVPLSSVCERMKSLQGRFERRLRSLDRLDKHRYGRKNLDKVEEEYNLARQKLNAAHVSRLDAQRSTLGCGL